MSDNNPTSPNTSPKKARLGRGLGSLLGGDMTADLGGRLGASSFSDTGAEGRAGGHGALGASISPVDSRPTKPIDEQSQIWQVPIDRLEPNTQQPRHYFAPEALQELSASIKAKGILQPIVARRRDERTFEIIAGERRWRAAQMAGLHEVPVILKKVDEQDSLELAIIENIQRQDLNAIEEAEAYDRLQTTYKLTQQEIATKVGKERATVANSLRLLLLPLELKEMVKMAELSAGHAKAILALEDPKEQVRIGKKIATEKLSVRATEQLIQQVKRAAINFGSGNPEAPTPTADVAKRLAANIVADLQKLIGTKVTIEYADSKGKLSIHFYSDDELNQLNENIRKAWQK